MTRHVSITDVCDFQGGTQPPKSVWVKQEKEGFVRMLQIRDFTQPKKNNIEYVPIKKTLKTCVESDILIGRYGASIGKICTGLSGAYNVALVKTIPNENEICRGFLLHLLKGHSFQNFILNVGGRAAQAGFNKEDLKEFQFQLPPLKEQKRIAAILDAADLYRQKTKALIAKYDELTQSLFLEMFGDPVTNPKGWEVIKLGDLGNWKSGGTPSRKISEYFEGSIPWLSSGELEKMYVSESKEFISEAAIIETSAKLVESGSILLGMYDTAALKSSINKIPLSCNQAIAFCKLDESKATNLFVYSIIQIAKNHYKRLQRGVRQKNLNLSMIKSIEILNPPITLQNQFAERVQAIEQQKAQAQESLAKAEDLFNSLLQRAFKGELSKEIV